ncbi:hypothetical protein ASZ78_003915 [Callipepla squamata]|uniref:Uncharacterized protein n=1 Tax=Callipepla squamata TaxID=9009 RepID=A0A226MSE9_CALSU|nr:hypothetical protein ASZ78_003915 [Callipepla squamata]
MEHSVRTHAKRDEEELLSAVESLRNQLRRTESSLQAVRTRLSSAAGREHSDSCFDQAADLTVEDFVQLNHNRRCSSNCKKPVGSASCRDFQRKHRKVGVHFVSVGTSICSKLKITVSSTKQMDCPCLSSKRVYASVNETINMFLFQISYLKSALDMHLVSIPKLEERIVTREAEVSAQDKILR